MKIFFDFAIFITMLSSTIAMPCDKQKKSTTSGVTIGEYCAAESKICTIGGELGGEPRTNGQIRYGDSETNRFSNWRTITSKNGFTCSLFWANDNHGFGMDPYHNKQKACQWRKRPSKFERKADKHKKLCGVEGVSCHCPGGQQARYGYDGGEGAIGERWTNWIDVEDYFTCNWDSFGGFDPARSRHKVCECRPIPNSISMFQKFQGKWVEQAYAFSEFKQTTTFTYEEGVSDTVAKAFTRDLTISSTVGYEYNYGGGTGSASVTTSISKSYEEATSQTFNTIQGMETSKECSAACKGGILYQWMIEGKDKFDKVGGLATCKFVCVPLQLDGSRREPSCPQKACNLPNCSCCTMKWTKKKGVDQKLCDNRRHLQDEGTAESAFDVSVDTNKADDGPVALQQTSGAGVGTSITVVATSVGLVSAILLA